jgi:hypothetical protein
VAPGYRIASKGESHPHEIVHYDLNTTDGGSGWVQLFLKQGLLATDDFRISLDYSNFNSGTENQGKFQIGFWSNSVQSAVKVQRGYDSYTAWRMPGYPAVHQIPTSSNSGTFIIEKTGNTVKLYVAGHEENPWIFENVSFDEMFGLQFDAWLEGSNSLSLDFTNFCLTYDTCKNTIPKPYTFNPGDPAQASEVNDNFDALYERVNKLSCETEVLKEIVCRDNPELDMCK